MGPTVEKNILNFLISVIASNKNNINLLNDDQRKIIERAANRERKKYKLAEVSSKKVKDKSDSTKIASLQKSLGMNADELNKKYKVKQKKLQLHRRLKVYVH